MHWLILAILSLAIIVILLFQHKYSVYGTILLGIAAFICLFFLDTAVLIRFRGGFYHSTGFDFVSEYHRLINGSKNDRLQIILNVIVYVPLGVILSEFYSSTRRISFGYQIKCVSLVSFGLSLCIECLQLLLQVGVFELTDLVMNTIGSIIGMSIALILRNLLSYLLGALPS